MRTILEFSFECIITEPCSAGIAAPTPDLEIIEDLELDAAWNVVVHNDPVNLMSYVTKVFIKVFEHSLAQAERHMMEVHTLGRSILWSGERERAELYVQQLHSFLLLATLERSV